MKTLFSFFAAALIFLLGACATTNLPLKISELESRVKTLEKKKLTSIIALAEEAGARSIWWRNGLTGGSDNLDGIGCASLSDGDASFVFTISGSTVTGYMYIFDNDGSTGESSPTIIVPDDQVASCSSVGEWLLVDFQVAGLTSNAADGSHWIDVSNTGTIDAGERTDGRCWYAKDNDRIECYDGANVQYWTQSGTE